MLPNRIARAAALDHLQPCEGGSRSCPFHLFPCAPGAEPGIARPPSTKGTHNTGTVTSPSSVAPFCTCIRVMRGAVTAAFPRLSSSFEAVRCFWSRLSVVLFICIVSAPAATRAMQSVIFPSLSDAAPCVERASRAIQFRELYFVTH
jgi:hypothetical protein